MASECCQLRQMLWPARSKLADPRSSHEAAYAAVSMMLAAFDLTGIASLCSLQPDLSGLTLHSVRRRLAPGGSLG